MNTELKKMVSFRPSEYDERVLEQIQKDNPYITNASDLLRLALHLYMIRKSEIEELKERVVKLESSQK